MIGNSLVFPVASPTALHVVTESTGLRHDPLEEGSQRGEAGVALSDRDRIEEGRMPGFMTFILLMHVSAGLLTASLAVPLMRRKVGPNALYGFRVRRTLEDPRVWYDANAFAGRCLFWCGIGTGLACLTLYWLPAIDPIAYAVACPTILLVGLAVGLVLSFRHLDHLTRSSER
jgi:hypothetical protein